MSHTFHIPVLGLGFSIDTPLKVARYGISSVISIVDDELNERMRAYHSRKRNQQYIAIPKKEQDSRSKRITAYLDFLSDAIKTDFLELKQLDFIEGNELCRYFELLPDHSAVKHGFELMMEYPEGESKRIFQKVLKDAMKMGSIDVNIMAKVDKMNFVDEEYTGDVNTDALAALRGFAKSSLCSSLVLSAGLNPKLYSYLEQFEHFFPDENGDLKKHVILKVSDFRSALIQSKFLAKKGIWVSEFRIESGLNCGGHAFATEGYLLGPILDEFKLKKTGMQEELAALYRHALQHKGMAMAKMPSQRMSVQGGIGTAEENNFLLQYYGLDATGWGSPFLLVPEVTNVDVDTLQRLADASEDDFYLSRSSPLGIQFNNFKGSSAEDQRLQRLAKGRPGSPCTKKYLCNNTEFTSQAICTASREYQHLKIQSLQLAGLSEADYQQQLDEVTTKICLCEGLCSSVYLKYQMNKPKENIAVAICPGPNLAYFNRVYSLEDMVGHIYGRTNLLGQVARPHMFIKELNLYVDYLQKDVQANIERFTDKKRKQLEDFKVQLFNGIHYYRTLFEDMKDQLAFQVEEAIAQLNLTKTRLETLSI